MAQKVSRWSLDGLSMVFRARTYVDIRWCPAQSKISRQVGKTNRCFICRDD